MKNFIQPGGTITVPAPAAVTSGSLVQVGGLIGVASGDAAEDEDLELVLSGVFELPKVSADAVTVGAALYLKSDGNLTLTSTDNAYAGVASGGAGSGVGVVRLLLNHPKGS